MTLKPHKSIPFRFPPSSTFPARHMIMASPEVRYLLSLGAIRKQAKIVGDAARLDKLNHFDLHDEQFEEVVDYVHASMERDFGPDKYHTIPLHSRWQHFDVGDVPRIARLLQQWEATGADKVEITRRLIDLFFVAVLLDAGAGDDWRYNDHRTGSVYERSEGIAVASLDMFNSFAFTASKSKGYPLVDGKGLEQLTAGDLKAAFQVTNSNPFLGAESRASILQALGKSLLAHSNAFGPEGRPGNLVDYMIKSAKNSNTMDINVIWDLLQSLMIPIWPKDRTTLSGAPIGDVWPLRILQSQAQSDDLAAGFQPFHKLTQWLVYSLMVPFQRILGIAWASSEQLTALAEYRNGGLFVDLGALTLKEDALRRGLKASGRDLPRFDAGDDVIVEWRSMTIALHDLLYEKIKARLGEAGVNLSPSQFLEAGTWKCGREIAARRRPDTKSSPILIDTDGTLF